MEHNNHRDHLRGPSLHGEGFHTEGFQSEKSHHHHIRSNGETAKPGMKFELFAEAALSHLELALANLAEQQLRLNADDRSAVHDAATKLCATIHGTSPRQNLLPETHSPKLPPQLAHNAKLLCESPNGKATPSSQATAYMSLPPPPPPPHPPPDCKQSKSNGVPAGYESESHQSETGTEKSLRFAAAPDLSGMDSCTTNGKHENGAAVTKTLSRSSSSPSTLTALTVGDTPQLTSALRRSGTSPAAVPDRSRGTLAESREPWQLQLLAIFDEIDKDMSGDLKNCELREALTQLSISPAKSTRLFRGMDKDGNGRVDRAEWINMIEEMAKPEAPTFLREFVDAMRSQMGKNGRLYPTRDFVKHKYVLLYNSPIRLAWDAFTTVFLVYIALSLPFTLGFKRFIEDSVLDALSHVELSLDMFFMADCLLNFRTSYIDIDGSHVKDGRRILWTYLKTWFLIDFLSSVPFDQLSSAIPNLQAMKLLKVGKVAKALKFMRLGRLLTRVELSGYMDEVVTRGQPFMKLGSLVLVTACLCHWLACFQQTSGDGFFQANPAVKDLWPQYLAGLYWGMTTMATVGYGDIIPESDSERLFTTFAMIIGCGFYAYVLGSVTSVVSTIDANMRAYHERMGLINAWLDHHHELPTVLSRRVRKHFKRLLMAKGALDDSAVLDDLSPELRGAVSNYIVHDDVRFNMLFEGLPSQALSLMVPIIQTTRVECNERIVSDNEPGVAMFIIVDGTAQISTAPPLAWSGTDKSGTMAMKATRTSIFVDKTCQKTIAATEKTIEIGDSFGEEIILGLEEQYLYTVTSTSRIALHMIAHDRFVECFQTMPSLVAAMKENFLKSPTNRYYSRLRPSMVPAAAGGRARMPDDISDALQEVKKMLVTLTDIKAAQAP